MELIAALLHRPDILYPDEPTIGLDILSQRSIRDFLKYYNEQTRTTLLLTSHYTADIEALCLAGLFLTYCLFLILELLSFWFVAGNGMQALSSAVFDFNNTPMNLYPHWVRRLGVFVLPVFVITNFPTLFAAGKLPPALTAWGLAVPVLAFGVQRLVWRRALRRYTSAGG